MFEEIHVMVSRFQSSACSNSCICIIILLLSFSFKSVMEFWAVTWALGLKKWHKSWRCRCLPRRNIPRHTHALLWECLEPPRRTLVHIKGVSRGLMVKKLSGTQGLVMGMTGKAYGTPIVGIEGLCCGFLLIQLH